MNAPRNQFAAPKSRVAPGRSDGGDEGGPSIEPHDWNFDSIPDNQLIACCYWEYARESAFLRRFKSRCVEANRNPKPLSEAFELVGKDARRVLSIGTVANSFLLGFGFDPDFPPPSDFGFRPSDFPNGSVSGLFPAPWQSLSSSERDYRAQLATGAASSPLLAERAGVRGNSYPDSARSPLSTLPSPVPNPAAFRRATGAASSPLLGERDRVSENSSSDQPFQRATGPDAVNAILFLADSISASQNFSVSAFAKATSHSVLRLDTHSQPADEIAFVQIQWGQFADDQIIDSFRAWVKANRPATIRPVAARGHKLKDWRAHLTRLAVMRLFTRFSAAELLDGKSEQLAAIWASKQFSGPTWLDVAKWHDARREARQIFHQLFPFLNKADDPISWPTARNRKDKFHDSQ